MTQILSAFFTFHHRYPWYNTEECTIYEIKQSYCDRNTGRPIYENVLDEFLMKTFFRDSLGDSERFERYPKLYN